VSAPSWKWKVVAKSTRWAIWYEAGGWTRGGGLITIEYCVNRTVNGRCRRWHGTYDGNQMSLKVVAREVTEVGRKRATGLVLDSRPPRGPKGDYLGQDEHPLAINQAQMRCAHVSVRVARTPCPVHCLDTNR
jgi:hypothetical protein